jgi:hypothetical protein
LRGEVRGRYGRKMCHDTMADLCTSTNSSKRGRSHHGASGRHLSRRRRLTAGQGH